MYTPPTTESAQKIHFLIFFLTLFDENSISRGVA